MSKNDELWALVILASTTIPLVGLYRYRLARYKNEKNRSLKGPDLWRNAPQEYAEQSVAEFSQAVSLLRKKRDILDVHSNDYFFTLQKGGWGELQQVLNDSSRVKSRLEQLLAEKRFTEAYQLSEFLLDRMPASLQQDSYPHLQAFSALKGWLDTSSQIIVTLIQLLEDAAVETQELGIHRQRKRQPTLHDIAQVRKLDQP
jgi:hypothetical protein